MGTVKINLPSYMKSLTNNAKEIKAKGSTVGENFNHLIEQFPDIRKQLFNEKGGLFDNIIISVNGENAYPEQLTKSVKDGDEVNIVFVIGGG